MSNIERIKNISEEINLTSNSLIALQSEKMCARMAERNYPYEMSVIKCKERSLEFQLDNLFEELKEVYKLIKGV